MPMDFSFRDSIGRTFTIHRDNLLGHDVTLPKFKNAEASELREMALELFFIQGGTSTWYHGHNFYTKWSMSRAKGPYLSHLIISTDDTPKMDQTKFRLDHESDWHGHGSVPMMRKVLNILLKQKKRESEPVPTSFPIRITGIPLDDFGWNLDRPLRRLLDRIDAHPEPSAIELVWYMFPDYSHRSKSNELQLGQLDVPGDVISIDFSGLAKSSVYIKVAEGTYMFTDEPDYGHFHNPMDDKWLHADSCGYVPKNPPGQHGWVMSTEHARCAISFIETVIGRFPEQ